MRTGYPVIVVAVAETDVQAIASFRMWKLLDIDIGYIACIDDGPK
jgi:hypothetical protein